MKILVTGFGNFDHFTENPSGDLAELVDGETIRHTKIYGRRLDVSWQHSWTPLQSAVRAIRPDALLAFGLADEPAIRLETTARNRSGYFADSFGKYPSGAHILPHGPDDYATGLPVDWLLKEFNHGKNPTRIPARLSADAGDYLCNFLFYRIMHELAADIPVRGFIHIPAYPPENAAFPYSKTDVLTHAARVIGLVAHWMEERRAVQS